MELVREFRHLSQVILLDYGADCAKLQRRREQGKQIHRMSMASQMIHTAAPTNTQGSDMFTVLTAEELSASINQEVKRSLWSLLPTRLKEGRTHDKCALTDDLREQFLQGHALMIQRESLFI